MGVPVDAVEVEDRPPQIRQLCNPVAKFFLRDRDHLLFGRFRNVVVLPEVHEDHLPPLPFYLVDGFVDSDQADPSIQGALP